ncbi:MAG: M28 family peptidase [Candidatus Freyarchaeota archaeon]
MSREGDVAPNDEILGWIREIFSFGYRRPGTQADCKAEDYIVRKLEEFGITDVEKQPYQISRWEADKWGLTVSGEEVPCFYTPNTAFTGSEGIDTDMVYVGDGSDEDFEAVDVKGKIVLVDVHFPLLRIEALGNMGYFVWDPAGTLSDFAHPATWIYPNWWRAYRLACLHRAAAVVGVLADYPTNEDRIYIPYFGPLCHDLPDWFLSHIGLPGKIPGWIPGLWVNKAHGTRLVELVKEGGGKARAHLTLTGSVEPSTTHNVIARLPGGGDDVMVVHSHHDGPWSSAVEDASGVAEVLAVAEYMAKTPRSERNKTIVFLFTSSHFGGPARGDATFIEGNPDITSKLMLDVCIEHIAKDFDVKDGEWVDTGMPEPRSVFVHGGSNEIAREMASILADEVKRHDLRRLIILPGNTPLGVPTDANAFYRSGYPIYSYISGPEYLFDPCDTIDKVAADQLNPVASAFIKVIQKMDKAEPSKVKGR